MLSYCFKCVKKKIESKHPTVVKKNNGRMILLWNYTVYNSKISRLIKKQEASGLLSRSFKLNSFSRSCFFLGNNKLKQGIKWMKP